MYAIFTPDKFLVKIDALDVNISEIVVLMVDLHGDDHIAVISQHRSGIIAWPRLKTIRFVSPGQIPIPIDMTKSRWTCGRPATAIAVGADVCVLVKRQPDIIFSRPPPFSLKRQIDA